jgi:uncharacterized protein
VQTFIDVGRFWRIDDFTIEDSFENGDGAALFGKFATARSFREGGSYRIKSNPDGSSVEV